MTSDDARSVRIDVTADKPGRRVVVDVDQPAAMTDTAKVADLFPWCPSLSIEQDPIPLDHWTWLTPDEARAVARALIEAADDADARNASDPREWGRQS